MAGALGERPIVSALSIPSQMSGPAFAIVVPGCMPGLPSSFHEERRNVRTPAVGNQWSKDNR